MCREETEDPPKSGSQKGELKAWNSCLDQLSDKRVRVHPPQRVIALEPNRI